MSNQSCGVCQRPVFSTPNGMVCEMGHGGAEVDLAVEICRHNASAHGTGCPNPESAEGSCGKCRGLADACRSVARAVNDEPDSAACFLCKREAYHHLKYRGRSVCGTCAPFAGMGDKMITDCEAKALDAGGAAGGQYLDSIGVGELFERVTPEQWETFLGKVLEGYADDMRRRVSEDPPF